MEDYGIWGILAVLLAREIINYLDKKRSGINGLKSGDMTPEYWREQFHIITRDAMEDIIAKELHEIRNDTTKLRESGHRTNELLQQISNKLDFSFNRK